jgi:hypothetical protein
MCFPWLMLQVGHVHIHTWLFELVKITSVQRVFSVFIKFKSLSADCFLAVQLPCRLHSYLFLYWTGIWQEKAPYEAKAAKRKSDYEKLMTAYNKKQVKYFCIVFFRIKWTCIISPASGLHYAPLRIRMMVMMTIMMMTTSNNLTSPNLKSMAKMTRVMR